MSMRIVYRPALALLLMSVLAACSSNKDKEQEPAPLPEFQTEQRFDKLWSQGVGNGQGKLYNRLKPAVRGSRIVAAAANGDVEAFDRLSGRSQWDADLDVALVGGVGIGPGLVLVASADGRVWALNEDTGETLWKRSVGSEVLSAPQTDGNIVVALTFSGDVVGLDAKDGSIKWKFAGRSPVLSLRASSTPLIVDEAVIVGLGNGKVVALEIGRAHV